MMGLILTMSIATAISFMTLLTKLKKKRYTCMIIDLLTHSIIAWMCVGTVTGLCVGIVASSIVSLYLLFNPFNLKSILPW